MLKPFLIVGLLPRLSHLSPLLILPLLLLLALSLLFSRGVYAVDIMNCGHPIERTTVPERVISLNQHTTELLLALGLEERMVGTAYLDDQVAPAYQAAYARIPVLADKYPSREVILATAPDFIAGGFRSAFTKKAAGERSALSRRGIDSFLSSDQCLKEGQKSDLALLFNDIRILGQVFSVEPRAEDLIQKLSARADQISDKKLWADGASPRALLLDSAEKAAFSAACCGMGQQLMQLLGFQNIASDVAGRWSQLSWERVVKEDPDWIILVDANWSSAKAKREFLMKHSVFSQLSAVKHQRFITIPFSATVSSVKFLGYAGQAQQQLAERLMSEDASGTERD